MAVCHVPPAIPEQFLYYGRLYCHARGTDIRECHSRMECTWSAVVFPWLVCVKEHPPE